MKVMQDVRKIIGFDSWTGGAHHYQRLIAALRDKGFELTLVHIGSWGSDKGRPSMEQLDELQVKDISAYARQTLPQILEIERPAAVIFLSTDTFAHRAFNRYCRQRGIPTINLYHGLVRVQAVDGARAYSINIVAHVRFIAVRLLKALTLIWPTYIRALASTRATCVAWRRFAVDILKGGLGMVSTASAEDARTDMCCVYVDADVEHAMHRYGFERREVVAVGNPDLMRFGLTPDLVASHLAPAVPAHIDVMYIDTGLIYTGYVFQSPEEFVEHMQATKDALAAHGRRLVFKPHPDHMRTNIPATLTSAGVEVCSNADFVGRLATCCACIVEPSTLSVVPALMGMPLMLAQYGKLRGQRFGDVLRSYPKARQFGDLESFETLLASASGDGDDRRTRQWIVENAGPLPADKMPHRVAAIVESLVAQRADI